MQNGRLEFSTLLLPKAYIDEVSRISLHFSSLLSE